MSNDLNLAQNHGLDLARTVMVPVTLFEADGEIGVMPSVKYDGDEDAIIHEYDPFDMDQPIEPLRSSGMPLAPMRAQGRLRRAQSSTSVSSDRALARLGFAPVVQPDGKQNGK
jgi:hypothetical protein